MHIKPMYPDFRFDGGGRVELTMTMIVIAFTGTVIIPAGFQCNLASVPRLFRFFVSSIGPNAMAAVIHDYLYETGSVPKATADKIFYHAMLHYKVKKWRAVLMYLAVRWFGFSAWKACRKKDA